MIWIQAKYISLLSHKLERFQIKGSNTFQFRCPYCGDSQKNEFKSRGYVYPKNNSLRYTCHNCGITKKFVKFLEDQDFNLGKEYRSEIFLNSSNASPKLRYSETHKSKVNLDFLPKLSDCQSDSQFVHYAKSRKIPKTVWDRIWVSSNFSKSFNVFVQKNKRDRLPEDARLVLPFYNINSDLISVQGRAIELDARCRYTTATFNEEEVGVFGWNDVDKIKSIYVTEGPIDSLFLDNAISIGGLSKINMIPDDCILVFVFDNQPRNVDVVRQYRRIANSRHSLVVWPDENIGKDVNDMVLNGMDIKSLRKMISDCTYSGLSAQLALTKWQKIDPSWT